jgi:hypothetical protein
MLMNTPFLDSGCDQDIFVLAWLENEEEEPTVSPQL